MRPTIANQLIHLIRTFLLSLLLGGTLAAQTILRPKPDQADFPTDGGQIVVEPIPGALCEMTVREGGWDGKVLFLRSQMPFQSTRLDGLKPNTTYILTIRLHGSNSMARVRFFTGPLPRFGAELPSRFEMIPGMPVVITATTWGAIDRVAWIDSSGRTVSTTDTLTLPSDPVHAGDYTFVVTGPGRTDRIPISIRAPAIQLPARLGIEAVDSGLNLTWPAEYVVGDGPGTHVLESSEDLAGWRPVDPTTVRPVLVGRTWTVHLPTAQSGSGWGFFRLVPSAGRGP